MYLPLGFTPSSSTSMSSTVLVIWLSSLSLKPATGRPCVPAYLRKSPQLEDASTHRSTCCGLRGTFEQSLRFRSARSAWMPAYSRPCYRRLDARVEHALLEQLMLFSNACIVLEDADTHRSTLHHRVNTHTKRGQSHVNAGTVPESTNARTQGRPVAGFTCPYQQSRFCIRCVVIG